MSTTTPSLPPRIAVVVGSTRPGRRGHEIASWVHRHTVGRERAHYDLVDLADHDLPNLAEPVPAIAGDYRLPGTREWARTVAGYDGFVLVTPEYNHGPTGALKNALDHLYAEWNDKAVGFVSYGVDGGQRAVEQLRLIVAELQMASVRAQVSLSLRSDLDPDGALAPAAHHLDSLAATLDQVEAWAGALRALRLGVDPVREEPAGARA